jgi:hypothetical protein
MLRGILHTHLLSRLIAGLFVVQFFAAGFCLMMPLAHAMPMVKVTYLMSDAMNDAESCTQAQAMDTEMNHSATHVSCTHCDQPDSFMQKAPVQMDFVLQPDLSAVPKRTEWISQPATFYSLMPTGPSSSSSLIYSTTQRIRI